MAMNSNAVIATEMERVRPKIATLFDRDDKFFSRIEKSTSAEVVSARDMRVPLELRPGGRFGHFDPDGGDLGRGDGPSYDKGLVPIAYLKEAYEFTRKAEWGTDDNRKAVLKTVRDLFAKALAEFRRNLDSLCMTDGTGTLASISNVSSSGGTTTATLDTAGNGYGSRLLRYGQFINIYASGLGTNRTSGGEVQISYLDLPTKVIKYLDVAGNVATDVVVVSGVSATPPVSLYGVPYHQSSATSGTWLGLDRATIPEIRGNSVTASGGLALPFARLALNKMMDRLGMDANLKVEAWMHPCQKQAYEELAQLIQIITRQASSGGDAKADLYFGGTMQLAGCEIKESFSWDKTRIDFIVPSTWGRAEMVPIDFYKSNDGRKIFEIRGSSGGVATSEIFYYTYAFNIFNGNPVAGSYISALTVPSGY